MKFLRTLLLCLLPLVSFAAYDPVGEAGSAVLMSAAAVSSAQVRWPGGVGVFTVVGTFASATVSLQFIGPDGATLITAGTATTCTSACAAVFYLPKCLIQATVSGATGSTAVTAAAAIVQYPR